MKRSETAFRLMGTFVLLSYAVANADDSVWGTASRYEDYRRWAEDESNSMKHVANRKAGSEEGNSKWIIFIGAGVVLWIWRDKARSQKG